MSSQIFQGDCLEEFKKIESNSIDLILTSPPYEDISGAGYTANSKDILFMKLYSDFLDKVFEQYYRILKPTGQVFFNIKSKTHNKSLKPPHWILFLESFSKFILKSEIIWKYAGSFDSTKSRFHLDYEYIFHFTKSDDIYINQASGIKDPLTSVWYIPHNISKEDRVHPTQMPIALADRIMLLCSRPNDVILDNFMGSGTTGISAKKFGCNFIGMELNPDNFKIAEKRINQPIEKVLGLCEN